MAVSIHSYAIFIDWAGEDEGGMGGKEFLVGMERCGQGVGTSLQIFASVLCDIAFQYDVRVVGIAESGMAIEVLPSVFFLLEEAGILDGISEA